MYVKKIAETKIHPIGIGTWAMGGAFLEDRTPYADYDNDDIEIEAIRYAIERGQNHIDTAQMYGAGHTLDIVAGAIRGVDRSSLFIASKVWKSHLKRSAVLRATEDMLHRLDTSYLDLLYVHYPWDFVPMKDYICGLNDAVECGMTRAIGVSNFTLEQLKEAVALSRYPIAANQIRFSLIERSFAPPVLLEFCRDNGIMIVAWKPLERGALAAASAHETLSRVAVRYDRTPAQIALNWLIAQPGVIAIPKASEKRCIDENSLSADFELDRTDYDMLSGIQ